MEKIEISVIIPAYNVEAYIEKTIRSVMNQTFKNIEIIVVNDASLDSTLAIIKKLAKEDNRVVVINKEKNEGLSSARNSGLNISRGKYIYHLDGDDWIDMNCLEETWSCAEKNNADMVVFDYYEEFSNGKLKYIKDFFRVEKDSTKIYRKLYFKDQVKQCVWNKLIKTNVYFKNNIFFLPHVSLGEDFAVTSRLSYVVNKVEKIDKAFVYYYQSPKSITRSNKAHLHTSWLSIFDVLENFLKSRGLFTEEEEERIYRYKLMNLQNFIVKDYDWKNEDYKKAAKEYLKFLKNEKFKAHFKFLKPRWKIVNACIYVFPSIFILKILTRIAKFLRK